MKFNGSAGATALIGMPGFVVGAQVDVDGEWHLAVETTADRAACGGCGSWAVGHGRRRGRLLDVVVGRSAAVVEDWLVERPQGWRDQITVAAIDAFRGYANALAASLPAATLVIDRMRAAHRGGVCDESVLWPTEEWLRQRQGPRVRVQRRPFRA